MSCLIGEVLSNPGAFGFFGFIMLAALYLASMRDYKIVIANKLTKLSLKWFGEGV